MFLNVIERKRYFISPVIEGTAFPIAQTPTDRTTDLYLSTKGSVVSKWPVIVSLAGRVSSAQFGNLVDFGFTLKAECGKFHGN